MRRIGYARVSSREQAINSQALEQQIERLKAAGATEIYSDVESGYKNARRSQLERVLNLVRSSLVDEVIITRLDRLSRKGVQSFTIFEDFLQSGVVLRALDEPFDLTNAGGRMTAGLLVVVAQHHSDQKSEAVKHGWQHLRNREVAMQPPFGYCKIDDRFHLDHNSFVCLLNTKNERSKADIAKEIVAAFFQAQSLRGCLRIINERYGIQTFAHYQAKGGLYARGLFRFSPGGLQRWLTNPVLQGHICYHRRRDGKWQSPDKWDIRYDTHANQAIITAEQASEIEEILKHNRQVRGYGCTSQKYPLSGLIFCGECRSACYSVAGTRGKTPGYNYYFQCKNWRMRGCNQKRTIRMEVIEEAIILELIKSCDRIADLASEPEQEIETVELRNLKQQLQGLKALGTNPAIEQAKRDIENQIAFLKFEEGEKSEKSQSNRNLLLWAFSDPNIFQNCSTEEKTRVFRALVEKVLVKEGKIIGIFLKL